MRVNAQVINIVTGIGIIKMMIGSRKIHGQLTEIITIMTS